MTFSWLPVTEGYVIISVYRRVSFNELKKLNQNYEGFQEHDSLVTCLLKLQWQDVTREKHRYHVRPLSRKKPIKFVD